MKRIWPVSKLALVAAIALIVSGLGLPAVAATTLPDSTKFGIRVDMGDVGTVGEWLDAGLDANFADSQADTGLMIAAWNGDIAMMELFLKHGADVNRVNRTNEQALMHAVWKGKRAAVAWLVDHGARIDREGNEWSALHYAVYAGHEEIVRFLIGKKADVNARSNNGSTVLMMAAHEGREKIAALLIEAGATRGIKNDQGEDALTWATRYKHLMIAKMVTSEGEPAQAVIRPQTGASETTAMPAPPAVENIQPQEGLAQPGSKAQVLSDDEYRKVLEGVAAKKTPNIRSRRRMSAVEKRSGDSARD